MTKIYNTCVLPSRGNVEAILDSIQPPLAEQQMEIARLMIRDYESFIRSSTFALNDKGKLVINISWFTGDMYFDDLSASSAILAQFIGASESGSAGRVLLEEITNLYKQSFRSTWFQDRIKADEVVNEFCEERIQEEWPVARQREIQDSVFEQIGLVNSGKIKPKEMFQDIPKEPTDAFRARYAGW